MKWARNSPSAVAFSGRIVVSGGTVNINDDYKLEDINFIKHYKLEKVLRVLTTVEEYDHVSNSWSKFPSMIDGRVSSN